MQLAGIGVAVANATPALRMRSDVVLRRPGGHAALMHQLALRAQGRWRWQHEPGVHG